MLSSFVLLFSEPVFNRYVSDCDSFGEFKHALCAEIVEFFTTVVRLLLGVELTDSDIRLRFKRTPGHIACMVFVQYYQRLPSYSKRHGASACLEFCRWYLINNCVPEVYGDSVPVSAYAEIYDGVLVKDYDV